MPNKKNNQATAKTTADKYTPQEWQSFLDTLRVGGEVPADMFQIYCQEVFEERAEAIDLELPAGVPF